MCLRKAGLALVGLLFYSTLLFAGCHSKTSKMETRTTIKGVLQDAAGKPVRDAIVMIASGPSSHNDIASVTNDSGEFFLSDIIVPGDYVLQIKTDRGARQQEVFVKDKEVLRLQY